MRPLHHLVLDPLLEKRPLTERQARQRNKVLVGPAGDDCEFGAHVDERGVSGREVEEQAGGAVDEVGSVKGGVSSGRAEEGREEGYLRSWP